MTSVTLSSTPGGVQSAGGRGMTAKGLRRALKKAGLKTTGRKSTLAKRAKKAHLLMRGAGGEVTEEEMANPISALPNSPESEDNGAMEVEDEETTGGRHRRRGRHSRRHGRKHRRATRRR